MHKTALILPTADNPRRSPGITHIPPRIEVRSLHLPPRIYSSSGMNIQGTRLRGVTLYTQRRAFARNTDVSRFYRSRFLVWLHLSPSSYPRDVQAN